MRGKVYLVGAGPGDPGLLTLRGAEALRAADVVVHDRLVDPAVLAMARPGAERVDAGKAPRGCAMPQQDINRLLVERARAGKVVVRLKGGDGFVFGRGGEECLALRSAGVPFEVVPGVTSAVAAPASAGIPLTHRGVASSFAVGTACLSGGRAPDLHRLSAAADTLVVLMVAGSLRHVAASLIDAGRPEREPAAVICRATTPGQRTIRGTLSVLSEIGEVPSPATLVVGPVVSLATAAAEAAARPSPRLLAAL